MKIIASRIQTVNVAQHICSVVDVGRKDTLIEKPSLIEEPNGRRWVALPLRWLIECRRIYNPVFFLPEHIGANVGRTGLLQYGFQYDFQHDVHTGFQRGSES